MVKLRNFTPHPITIYSQDNKPIREIKSEGLLRISEYVERMPAIDGISIVRKQFGEIALPEFEPDTYLIVSSIVLNNGPKRPDLLCPDTGGESVVRDNEGRILGVKRLVCQ